MESAADVHTGGRWRAPDDPQARVASEGSSVAVGIDAAVVANHHVVVRRPVAGGPGQVVEDFVVPPTLSGMATLSKRLAVYPGVVAVAEPTSMTWLPLAIALGDAGGRVALVGNRHSARLRSALAGMNKSDPIDADVLSRAGEFFALEPARIPEAAELALRRAAQRRGKAITDADRALRRLISLARWAFPDVWNAFAGSRPTALAVLGRWPHLDALRRARVGSIAEVIAAHTRGVTDVERRAEHIRVAAGAWREFWHGHLDLDGLAWETTELLDDLAVADTRVERATEEARRRWEALWGDDPLLLSVPGMGPVTAPTVRAFLADGRHLPGVNRPGSAHRTSSSRDRPASRARPAVGGPDCPRLRGGMARRHSGGARPRSSPSRSPRSSRRPLGGRVGRDVVAGRHFDTSDPVGDRDRQPRHRTARRRPACSQRPGGDRVAGVETGRVAGRDPRRGDRPVPAPQRVEPHCEHLTAAGGSAARLGFVPRGPGPSDRDIGPGGSRRASRRC